jgi:uncharacterized protein (TIGR03435 family)
MNKSLLRSRHRRRLLARMSWLAAFVTPAMIGVVSTTLARAQSPVQATTAAAPAFEYEVASVKLNRSGGGNVSSRSSDDGLTITNFPLSRLIQQAFGVPDYQISGAPAWANSESYDINAKMEGSVADALKKLSPDDRRLARQHMLQAILADRFKLAFHRDTKELPVYWLAIAKNGPKLHEAKPGDTYPNGVPIPVGRSSGAGLMMMSGGAGSQTVTGQAVPISNLARSLSGSLGRPVLDKTGLTGAYDFTLTYEPDPSQLQGLAGGAPSAASLNGQPPLLPDAPGAASLLTAVQEQLGLKLESGKGPVEIIVIDRIERAVGN